MRMFTLFMLMVVVIIFIATELQLALLNQIITSTTTTEDEYQRQKNIHEKEQQLFDNEQQRKDIERLQNENERLQQKLDELQLQHQILLKQNGQQQKYGIMNNQIQEQQQQNEQNSKQNDENVLLVAPLNNPHQSPTCKLLPNPIPSSLYIWNSFIPRIIKSSRHENDRRWALEDFTAALLQLVSPDRLQRSLVGLPHDWKPVRRVLNILYRRWKQPTTARKLRILVMGGSLIVGVNCRKIISDNSLFMRMPNRLCTWSHRLQSFLNNVLGGDFVSVTKIALGGTNTATGFVMWDSDFLPEESKHPDILINAYSTNDMHILTVLEAREGNQTLRDKVMEMTQDFVRSVMMPPSSSSCADNDDITSPPLLLHMDDYLGNEQRELLTTMELSQAVSTLSSYYGFTSMSYANVVRDIVYGDSREEWISPKGWWEGDEMVREIHPGMGMHIISTWVTAFTLLHLGVSYCTIEGYLAGAELEQAQHEQKSENDIKMTSTETTRRIRPYHVLYGFPPLKGKADIPGKPKVRPHGLPPPLTKTLSLENVTQLWMASSTQFLANSNNAKCQESGSSKCPFSWISGISKQGLNATYAQEYWFSSNFVTHNSGWAVNSDGKKVGISPTDNNTKALLDMEFTEISAVTVFYMKSYGEKWQESRMALSVSQKQQSDEIELKRTELVGVHNKQTSETYTERIDFDGNHNLPYKVRFELIGGTTFKIMGLAVCKAKQAIAQRQEKLTVPG